MNKYFKHSIYLLSPDYWKAKNFIRTLSVASIVQMIILFSAFFVFISFFAILSYFSSKVFLGESESNLILVARSTVGFLFLVFPITFYIRFLTTYASHLRSQDLPLIFSFPVHPIAVFINKFL